MFDHQKSLLPGLEDTHKKYQDVQQQPVCVGEGKLHSPLNDQCVNEYQKASVPRYRSSSTSGRMI